MSLLLLAAERGDRDVFDAVLGVLHRVAKVTHKSGKMLLEPSKDSGARGVPLHLPGEVKGENRYFSFACDEKSKRVQNCARALNQCFVHSYRFAAVCLGEARMRDLL